MKKEYASKNKNHLVIKEYYIIVRGNLDIENINPFVNILNDFGMTSPFLIHKNKSSNLNVYSFAAYDLDASTISQIKKIKGVEKIFCEI